MASAPIASGEQHDQLNQRDHLGALVVEAEVPWSLVQEPRLAVSLPEPVEEVRVLVGWEDAPPRYPRQTGLTGLERRLDAPAEPEHLGEGLGENAAQPVRLVRSRVGWRRSSSATRCSLHWAHSS